MSASPIATPTGPYTPAPPMSTLTPTSNATATVRFEAVQAQLAQVSVEQTATAAAPAPPTATPITAFTPQPSPSPTLVTVLFPPPGQLVFTSNRGNVEAIGHLYVMDSDGTNVRQLTQEPGSEPSYAQSVNQIFFSRRAGNHVSLYTIRPDGQAETRVDDRDEDNWEPALSPDGRNLAFVSSRYNRDWEIYVINSDRTASAQMICDGQIAPDLLKWGPAWSSDSQQLAFVVSEKVPGDEQYEGQGNIWLANTDGTNCRPLTSTPAVIDKFPDWSPDGRYIVFASNRGDGIFRLYQMDSDGRNQHLIPNSPDHVNYPAWSLDGNWLTFSVSTRRADHLPDAIFVMTIKGEHATNISDGIDEDWYSIWLPSN
ncbi:MAG: PD40 domain-containing protein [Chloroflexi bacterium]|nr:PD40 domain-containing protein [Chloroflexota bacterium]